MRFLANENFPRAAVEALRATGNDVAWMMTISPGRSDQEVLALAAREGRILLTFDKDFGELAKNSKLPAASGVILLRVPLPRPDGVGAQLAALITARNDWAGHFSVVEPTRVRMRLLS
jgi:predicted nuclease of predicted toxin-antitoxin system